MSYAQILSLDEFLKIKDSLGKIAVTSGGFDPIHPGHITSIVESKKDVDTLVVIVNGDSFLRSKKGRPFQDLDTRCKIVSGLRGVDYVIPYEDEKDFSIKVPLEKIRPYILKKGGDRDTPESLGGENGEWGLCQRLGIKVEFNVGLPKYWSSSWFLKDWEDYILEKYGFTNRRN